jgi:PhzF family phenazine biosynthesis protein
VDAFTESPFKGNPAAVCLLEEDRDDAWLQAVATEFNLSQTGFLTRIHEPNQNSGSTSPGFRLRWFTPVAEVKLCGHATLAAAHILFTSELLHSDLIEFSTLSGILTAKRIPDSEHQNSSVSGEEKSSFFIELDFPVIKVDTEFKCDESSAVSNALIGVTVTEIKKTAYNDLFVVVESGQSVVGMQPQLDEIKKCGGRGLMVSGIAPIGSGFDFYSRFFCPKLGINEDPVCGSAHCALASYWSKKLGKSDFVALAASARGGVLNVQIDDKNERVLLRGKAVTVMEGSILA